jgi:hypothetical protein
MMATRRRAVVLVALTIGIAVVAGAPPAGAKRVPPCTLLTPEDLEPIFELTLARGRLEQGDRCRWAPPPEDDVPEIVVTLRAEQYASVKKAKRAFQQSSDITTQLSSAGITEVDRVGDKAFYAFFVGTDQLTLRIGRFVAELGVDQADDPEAIFPEQAVAVGQVIATKLRVKR